MNSRQTWLIAAVCASLSLATTTLYLALQSWFGVSDLSSMVFWSLPFAILVSRTLAIAAGRLHGKRPVVRAMLLALVGSVAGIGWFFVAASLLGGWIMAFSFPVGFIWLVSAAVSGLFAAGMRTTQQDVDRSELAAERRVAADALTLQAALSTPRRRTVARAKLLALALAAPLSIHLELLPSIPGFVGLFMTMVVLIAVAGVIRPELVLSRRWMKRVCAAGAAISALQLVVLKPLFLASMRRPVILVVPAPVPAQVRVMYEVRNVGTTPWWHWTRRYSANDAGLAYTHHKQDDGGSTMNDPFPITVVTPNRSRGMDTIGGKWIKGGYTTASGCELSFDEFAIGDTSTARLAWLDSASR